MNDGELGTVGVVIGAALSWAVAILFGLDDMPLCLLCRRPVSPHTPWCIRCGHTNPGFDGTGGRV